VKSEADCDTIRQISPFFRDEKRHGSCCFDVDPTSVDVDRAQSVWIGDGDAVLKMIGDDND